MPRARGFTLIELLVTVTVIGIIAATAVLSVGVVGSDRALRDASQRLARVAEHAASTALFSGRPMALQISARSYRVVRREQGAWLPYPASERDFAAHALREGLRLSVADGRGGWDDEPALTVVFDPEGTADMAVIRVFDATTDRRALFSISPMAQFEIDFTQPDEVSS